MTSLLYQTNPYLQKFAARVLAIQQDALILDRTAFYPGGGRQSPDRGTLLWHNHAYPLARLQKEQEHILHWVHTDQRHPRPPAGAHLHGLLDWTHRYHIMRAHTALHIICGVIWRDHGALVTGGNIHPLRAYLDFELDHVSRDLASHIEQRANAEVIAARDVKTVLLPRHQALHIHSPSLAGTGAGGEGISSSSLGRGTGDESIPPSPKEQGAGGEGLLRVVEIVGLHLQPDNGTHVANTREVGHICLVKHTTKGRSHQLHIALDQ